MELKLLIRKQSKVTGSLLLEILDKCLEKGVLFYLCGNSGEVIRMIPPLTITKEEIDAGLRVLDEALTEITSLHVI